MREETLRKLEFDHVRKRLAGFCSGQLGKSLAAHIAPSTQPDQVKLWLQQGRELAVVAEDHGPPPLAGIHDIRQAVADSASPTPLEGDTLADVAETLSATSTLRLWLDRVEADAQTLAELGGRVTDYTALADEIRDRVDPRGHVYDHATPKLRSIRRTIDSAQDRINIVFDRLLNKSAMARMLQFASTTYHNDRVVLPLRAEHRGRVPGIIHRTSDSGATLFVEPSEVVELNNTIVNLREDEQKEIVRILRELSLKVHAEAEGILRTMRAIAQLDLNRAKWAYLKHHRCVFPVIDDDGRLDVRDARHPVLLDLFERENEGKPGGKGVVPIDVRLGVDFDALIVTGPNTGGKTVAIKTVGLLALMVQSGLPVPAAEGSRFPVYKRIFVDIGDEQSLQQSLSTFSSHLSNQLDVLNRSGPHTLVLMDELGAGTDPDEGAAIGKSIIEELLSRNAQLIATTHLSALKAIPFTIGRVDNACVEFDADTLRPLYRLLIGEPGASNAITIADRLGMPKKLVDSARRHLAGHARALDRAIEGTLESRRRAETARREADDAAKASESAREALDRKRLELEAQHDAYRTWTQWVNALQPGDAVFVRTANQVGQVVRMQLHRQSAVIAVGAFEMEAPLTDIVQPDEPA